MWHSIDMQRWRKHIGPQIESMSDAISTCVHCGYCLAVCPTYQVQGEEMDSPRGRIIIMKNVLEGELKLDQARTYLDRCLGCLACTTACPSGVRYGELITPFRAYARMQADYPAGERLQHRLVKETLPYLGRFRAAAMLSRPAHMIEGLLPESLARMTRMLPDRLPPAHPLPALTPARGTRRARVALLAGCVQQVLAPEINWATLRVLSENGVEVVVPEGQGCCGALLLHTGDHAEARRLAKRNLAAFSGVDVVLTNAAGCGSGMKEYGFLFEEMKEYDAAVALGDRVQEASQFLAELGLIEPPPLRQPLKVAYHDACHLAHAQGITAEPRSLLKAIPNLTLLEIDDGMTCCGSAGTYNLEQPELAGELGRRKAQHILDTGAEAVAAGNIGCIVQIRSHLQALDRLLPVFHTIELLDLAYKSAPLNLKASQ